MGYPDIERARRGQAALGRIVAAYPGQGMDLRALRRVVDLCRDISEAIDDDYCREKVRVVAEFAAELLSRPEHRARGTESGVDFLRRQVRSALELLQSRLYSLERARLHGAQGLQRALYAAPHAFKR